MSIRGVCLVRTPRFSSLVVFPSPTVTSFSVSVARIVLATSLPICILFVACGDSTSDLNTLAETTTLEQVGTIEVQETDERFIGQFESAHVTLDPFRLYIADREMHRIAVVDRDGTIRRLIGEQGQGPGELQEPQRAVRVGDRIIVADTNAQLSVFDTDGTFRRRGRLPEGVWRGGLWSLSTAEDGLYMAIQDVDPRTQGLKATPEQDVVARLTGRFEIDESFGTYPELYQENEYVWRYTTLDVNESHVAVGYYLVPHVQVYDLTASPPSLVETVDLTHPHFTGPDEPLPMDMPRPELQAHAEELSFVWQTFLLDDRTVVQVFNNRTEAFYDNQLESERHHYAILGRVGTDKQLALELPGRVFARDERDRLYVELNPTPDERKIGIYEVNWP